MAETGVTRRFFTLGMGVGGLGLASEAWAVPPAAGPEEALWRGLELCDDGGRAFQVGAHAGPHGAVTLVKLWAHWCPACLSEMSALTALLAALGTGVLDVVLVSHPEYWARDVAVARHRGLPFRLATPSAANGPGVVRAALTQDGAYAVPRSLAFRGRDGAMAWRREGALDWASAGVVAAVKALVG